MKDLFKADKSKNFEIKYLIINETIKFVEDTNLKEIYENKNPKESTQYCCISYTWRKIKKSYKNSKFKISAMTCNGEFELPHGSYSTSDI